jgi:hypothetical protein
MFWKKHRLAIISSLIVITLFLVFFIPTYLSQSDTPKFVSISIILDNAKGYEELENWLETVQFHNFTFVIDPNFQMYWLDNQTRCDTMKSFGKIIPLLGYMQLYDTTTRKLIVDNLIQDWQAKLNQKPAGFFCFQPDTYTVNYLAERDITYVQGYCFDQYLGDYMTMRGGWQMPYLADKLHANKPSRNETGVVILPHVTWDWIASFTESPELNTHILNLKSFFKGNMTLAQNYFFDLIDSTLYASKPFGFVSVQFEWCWAALDGDLIEFAQDWIEELLKKKEYTCWSYETFTN